MDKHLFITLGIGWLLLFLGFVCGFLFPIKRLSRQMEAAAENGETILDLDNNGFGRPGTIIIQSLKKIWTETRGLVNEILVSIDQIGPILEHLKKI